MDDKAEKFLDCALAVMIGLAIASGFYVYFS